MKKTFPLLVFMAFFMACSRENVRLNFVKDSEKDFQAILAESKIQKKLVFIDVYTTWCGPCKYMDTNVFSQKEVADLFNKKFINYKVDGESIEGVNLGIKYNVSSYPTYIFVDANGKPVHRIEGTIPADYLIREANDILSKNN